VAKKVTRIAKLQFMAGQSKPGPELAGLGIDMVGFTKKYNEDTKSRMGEIVPVIITAYDDRSFDFELKTTPASFMIKKALGLKSGASNQAETVSTMTVDQVRKIAEYKLVDLNTNDVEQAIKIIEGTARNMGVMVDGMSPKKTKTKVKIVDEPIEVIASDETASEEASTEDNKDNKDNKKDGGK
jgi:large subunit ribosomal protein L11